MTTIGELQVSERKKLCALLLAVEKEELRMLGS